MSNEEEGFEQWTARQVQDLERVNGEQAQALIELRERIKRLETNVFTDTGFNRITELAKRVTDEVQRLNKLRDLHDDHVKWASTSTEDWARSIRLLERITALENGSRLVGTGGLIEEIMGRLSALEGYSRLVKPIPNPEMKLENVIFGNAASTMPADFKPNIEMDWTTAPEEFSPAIGRGVVPLDPENIRRIEHDFSTTSDGPDVISITGVEHLKEEMYQRGYSAGISAAIDKAVSRTENWLEEHRFSPKTTKQIVDQIRAVVETKLGRQGPPDLDGHTPPKPRGR